MASARPIILATGDVTADWSFVAADGAGRVLDTAWAWTVALDAGAVSFGGGALRLAEMLQVAAAQTPGGPLVVGPAPPPDLLASPLDQRVTRTFSIVSSMPRSRDDATPVWRFQRFMGRRPAQRFDCFLPSLAEPADVVAIQDLDLGYRAQPQAWGAWRDGEPRAIVLSTSEPFTDNPLLLELLETRADRLTVVVRVVELRKSGASVSHPLSWERTAEEVDAAVRGHLLGRARRVVVQLELSGALLVERDGDTTLVFDPSVPEGGWMARFQGVMPAYPLCYVTALALPLATGQAFDVSEAVRRAVQASRVLLREGLQPAPEHPGELRYPMEGVAAALRAEPADIHATLHPVPDGRTTIIDRAIGPDAMVEAAMKLALGGPGSLPPGVPVERVGHWSSVDRREIETLRGVGHVIDEYVTLYRAGAELQRPLSVAVFGPPGAGKSFAVKETIGQKIAGGVRTLEFNLSQFEAAHELVPAYHQARDAVLQQRLPLVFWDEFDTPLDGRELGWLRHFLAPMQDGKFREDGAFHPLGPAIFVFAGGTASSFAEFAAVHDEQRDRAAKKPDFISRLRGYVDVLGPNRTGPDDMAVVLRRALLLRSLLLRKAPLLVSRRDGRELLRIEPALLRAFLLVDEYRHGARSMEALIDMSQLAGALSFEEASLPAPHLLELHVDAAEFLGLVRAPA
jgi:hypothetical protein